MLTLYCNSFAGKDPWYSQFNQKTLMCGSHFLSDEIKQQCLTKQYILDDTGDNISHLNHLLGDLTGLYWVWKNTNDEFVGTNQYCRHYDEQDLVSKGPLNKNTLYVSFIRMFNMSVWDQYIFYHGTLGINMLSKAAREGKISLTEQMVDSLYYTNQLSACNMFFAYRPIFDRLCAILFEILFELYEGSKYIIEFVQQGMHVQRNPNEKRLLAFLAERILTIIYNQSNYFFGPINVVPINDKNYD